VEYGIEVAAAVRKALCQLWTDAAPAGGDMA
jgi:hypothetical protein